MWLLCGLAAAFAFTTIFALAAHIAGIATALAFTTIEAFAAVLAGISGGGGRAGIVARAARDGDDSAGDQSSHGSGNN
jgi:hypothetical protein